MKYKHLILAFLVLFVMAFSIDHVINTYKNTLTNEVYMKADFELSSKVLALKSIIDRNVNLMVGLEAFVTADYLNGQNSTSIENYLSTLYGANNSVYNLLIAPKGIVTYIYPLKGNETFTNWDLLHDPRADIQEQLKRDLSTKQITVNGPFQLLQGNTGIVARKALYQNDIFWGFVSIGLDLDDILTRSGLGRSNSGDLSIAVRVQGNTAFYGNDSIFQEKNLSVTIPLADGAWELAALPNHKGLQEIDRRIWLTRGISFLALLLSFSIFYYIVGQRDKLSAMVETRTQELLKANEELTSANEELLAGEEELREQYTLLDTYNQALKDSQQQLSYLAYHDVLTGIANRTQFQKSLMELLKGCQKDSVQASVIFFNLDNFKIVNDTHGHPTGDLLLKQITERIAAAQPQLHCFARVGGDEFAILVRDEAGGRDIEHVAEQILQAFKDPFLISEHMFFASASIGISKYPESGRTYESLMKNADIAMYTAKKEGGNNYKLYESCMDMDSLAKLELGNHLRQALDRGELEIQYQPQVDCRQGEVIGIEALLRWNHTTKGYISPEAFIPLAEELGLIIPIGEWVLRKACEQTKVFLETYKQSLRVSVNLSVKQLFDPCLVRKVQTILEETKLDAKSLELEITENVAMKDEQFSVLHELLSLGVTISVDDFGTQYSSLSYLKRFPVTKIKLDQSFVRGIGFDAKDRSMIKAIIYVAQSFGLEIIAEGVENEEQVRFLLENGCYQIQGYYFYRPMEAAKLHQAMQENWKPRLKSLGQAFNA